MTTNKLTLSNLEAMKRGLFKQRDQTADETERERIEDEIEAIEYAIEKLKGESA